MTLATERFKASVEAEYLWSKLLAVFARARLGDPQHHGWGDTNHGGHSDLATRDRVLYMDAQMSLKLLGNPEELKARALRDLSLLAVLGSEDAEKAAKLAERRLRGRGTSEQERRMGLTHERACELIDGVKEFLLWNLASAATALPPLPF